MLYRRTIYRVKPDRVQLFTQFFHDYLLPVQFKHGARLLGRWVTQSRDEIMAIWQYRDEEEYRAIEERVRQDPLSAKAREKRSQLGELFVDRRQDFLLSTGSYETPRHSVAVAGYITDERQRVLLVRTHWRDDTWELPGGIVEHGETPHEALRREILEETGVDARLLGVAGVYFNATRLGIVIVFRGQAVGGRPRTSPEIKEVAFVDLTPDTVERYIKRPQALCRVLHAMQVKPVPYEAYDVRPYRPMERMGG